MKMGKICIFDQLQRVGLPSGSALNVRRTKVVSWQWCWPCDKHEEIKNKNKWDFVQNVIASTYYVLFFLYSVFITSNSKCIYTCNSSYLDMIQQRHYTDFWDIETGKGTLSIYRFPTDLICIAVSNLFVKIRFLGICHKMMYEPGSRWRCGWNIQSDTELHGCSNVLVFLSLF